MVVGLAPWPEESQDPEGEADGKGSASTAERDLESPHHAPPAPPPPPIQVSGEPSRQPEQGTSHESQPLVDAAEEGTGQPGMSHESQPLVDVAEDRARQEESDGRTDEQGIGEDGATDEEGSKGASSELVANSRKKRPKEPVKDSPCEPSWQLGQGTSHEGQPLVDMAEGRAGQEIGRTEEQGIGNEGQPIGDDGKSSCSAAEEDDLGGHQESSKPTRNPIMLSQTQEQRKVDNPKATAS